MDQLLDTPSSWTLRVSLLAYFCHVTFFLISNCNIVSWYSSSFSHAISGLWNQIFHWNLLPKGVSSSDTKHSKWRLVWITTLLYLHSKWFNPVTNVKMTSIHDSNTTSGPAPCFLFKPNYNFENLSWRRLSNNWARK